MPHYGWMLWRCSVAYDEWRWGVALGETLRQMCGDGYTLLPGHTMMGVAWLR